MIMHSLRRGRSNSIGVLPNLRSDIEQRDHDRNCADDLSEIGEVVEIHALDVTSRTSASIAKPKKRQTTRLPYDSGTPFTCLSYSAALKYPLDSAIKPESSIFHSS